MASPECDRCEEWRRKGATYCGECGRFLGDGCPMCQMWKDRGAAFCGECGGALDRPPAEKRKGNIFHTIIKFSAALFLLSVVCALLADITSAGNILDALENKSLGFYIPLGLEDIVLFRLSGTGLSAYFVIELAVIGLFGAYATYRTFAVRKECGDDPDRMAHTDLSAAASILCVTLATSLIYLMFMAAGGHTADTSWMDRYSRWEMMFMLTNAGLQEELAYRLVLIGIPMAVIAFAKYRDVKCWRFLLGGFGMSKAAFILILVSSAIFGLGHYDGWGWVKVIDAFAGGILFAYAYSEYGLHVCVLIHFVNDTLTLFPGGIFIELAMMGLGLIILIYWIIKPNRSAYRFTDMPSMPPRPEGKVLSMWERH
ncbi:CPBP family intramembrane glutamic endopeptidase [Methanomethylophilus alvi]|uniref:CPBP family intramembrane glutamic endopeptidase n=1 Tax=Methanomethylophilus alvi TaxID=1291540 RepID=UPI0037DD2284